MAIVHGVDGRVGSAFATRLRADGYVVLGLERPRRLIGFDQRDPVEDMPLLFDCAYQDGKPEEHVERAVQHLSNWRARRGIFIPSSMWIGTDSPYGRAKLVIEQLAHLYRSVGANVVTDRIGYFPGDGVEPDPNDPFIDKLVDGDTLYARVMEKMLCSA